MQFAAELTNAIKSLTGDQIRERLAELDLEQRTLKLLLRPVTAREREEQRQREGVRGAD
jgi:hypothetical protein